ncbi:hypothetical protein Q5P01_021888 [Channa striata]|uniref:Uncharacterized protein n=1 Tax=Channa striata TaxID=64152 RepID=A0AA88LWK3_CHASR|nr:hypothetical protein Q5P01_021888 [Channa striata]
MMALDEESQHLSRWNRSILSADTPERRRLSSDLVSPPPAAKQKVNCDRKRHRDGSARTYGGVVEGAIKSALGGKDKSGDKKKTGGGGGGGFSLFGGNKKKEQGGADEGKGGFISNMFDKGDDNKAGGKKSGFSGLFAEQGGAGAAGVADGGVCEYTPPGENAGASGGAGGADLYDDLLNVATEMSGGHDANLQPHPGV